MSMKILEPRSWRRLLLALWVGGLAVIDLLETPTRFAIKEVDRNQIIVIGRRIFAALNRMEVVLGALMLPFLVRDDGRTARMKVLPMWATALWQFAILQPRMRRVGEGLDYAGSDRSDPRHGLHRRLHLRYVALDGLKLVLGVWAILSDGE
ncbi:MAG TPA: DUF4149 domain-containing protein [Chloroflexota bacterium]|nr:DUF4149 domain-containing protein [Chloroflexota bacterium]